MIEPFCFGLLRPSSAKAERVPSVTYYVAIPFISDAEGNLRAGEAEEAPSAHAALHRAYALSAKHCGAIAFQRTGEPDVREFKDAVILGKFGETPENLSEL